MFFCSVGFLKKRVVFFESVGFFLQQPCVWGWSAATVGIPRGQIRRVVVWSPGRPNAECWTELMIWIPHWGNDLYVVVKTVFFKNTQHGFRFRPSCSRRLAWENCCCDVHPWINHCREASFRRRKNIGSGLQKRKLKYQLYLACSFQPVTG